MHIISRSLLVMLIFFGASTAGGTDLAEVYQIALVSDPTLREANANRLASSEASPQARAALLPLITGFYSRGEGDSSGSSTFQQVDSNGVTQNVINSFKSDTNRIEQWSLDLRQPLFRWDRIVGLRQAQKTVAQAEIDYQAAQQDLMLRVAEAYFNVLAAQDTLDAEVANKEATKRQLEQAEKRFEVGLIAITDVLEAQAAYDLAVATDIGALRLLSTAKESLREITGDYIDELQRPGDDLPLVNPDPASADTWVEQAIKNNLVLNSTRLQADVAKDQVRINRSGHMPTLDLIASRSGFDRDSKQANALSPLPLGAPSPTDANSISNSISLQLNIPIFSGGNTSSVVRQSVYRHRAARERVERVARATERSTRDAYDAVVSQIARVRALRRAVESADKALQASEAGFEVGTRTTVDVLNARQLQFRARTSYARTRYDYIVNVLRLKEAAGSLSVQDIGEVNSWLAE
ncbi:MAG: TolC family outer membrane protein [Gammaproteobacteria bacterium]|nr:TolC family outer membrane protein [Gammaproteobacteria bacterium]